MDEQNEGRKNDRKDKYMDDPKYMFTIKQYQELLWALNICRIEFHFMTYSSQGGGNVLVCI